LCAEIDNRQESSMCRESLRTALILMLMASALLIGSTRARNCLGLVGADRYVTAPHQNVLKSLNLAKHDRSDTYFRDGYLRAWRGRGFK